MSCSTQKNIAATILILACGAPAAARDNPLVLEEVIVTAQKRVETLADTPMTLNVLSGAQIADSASFGLTDLDKLTSGLAIEGSGFDADIATRGLGTDLNAPISPRVTTYVDGAYIDQQRGLFSGLYDLQQVELLRGPQGTLYGRTSPAGALTVRTRDPNVREVEASIRQSFTEHDGSNTQLGLSVPLVENELALRVAGLYDSNEDSDVENLTLDRQNENETTAWRATLLWEPNDRLNLRVSYHDIEDKFDIDPVVKGNGIEFDDRVAVADFSSKLKNESDYTIAELNYNFSNDWVATLVASSQDNTITRYWDDDASPVQGSEQTVISKVTGLENYELRLASQGNDVWDWTAGVFYQDSDSTTPVFADTYRALAPGLTLLVETTGPALISGEVWALFSHNTIHLSENGSLTVGLRYNDEQTSAQQTFTNNFYIVNEDGSLGPPTTAEFEGILPGDQDLSDDAFTGTLKYQYRLRDDFMAYASYDRGWRRGAANVSGLPQPPVFGAFDAEDSDNIELGFKWDILAGRGLFNAAVYYQVYSDFQYQAESVEFRNPEGDVSLASPVVNVDEAESYGVDMDVTVLLSQHWRLGAALSYNQAELTDAQDTACSSDQPLGDAVFDYNTCDLNGERAGQLPEWSGNINSEYTRPLGHLDSEWYLRGLFNAESEYYSTSEGEDLDSYLALDLFLGLREAAGRWDASVWVKNVFDESAQLKTERRGSVPDYVNGGSMESGLVWVRRQLNPRTLGVTLAYNF